MRIKYLERLPLLLASYPLAWLALFYAFVLRARLALGFWPAPYVPDPKDLGFTLHHMAVLLGLAALPATIVAALGLALIGPRVTWRRRLWRAVIWLTLCLAAWRVVTWLDPGQFLLWFGD